MSCAKWLSSYLSDTLVETGSCHGDGIDYALRYGFKEVHSIEIDKKRYEFCVNKFKGKENVHLYYGDSIKVLPEMLSKIKVKSTFLLDAHVSDVKQIHGEIICPIIEELKIIIKHSKSLNIKHTIMVDDAKFFNGNLEAYGRINLSDIKKIITDLDSSYVVKNGRKYIVAV